ncbi:alpha/beta fold hydrolase [Paenibacillus sp. XY044]|uniref:alpha/beta fold hydrolase n=1 Tax=Paenibacillus sp. XY044 TaxID=2026089 RepID=UPI000B987D65|nr:alpha/beta hydrolase [Paenibacillus sp. XY044]OZB98674.1 alpha/beta hydrolase [Paenibacillus sp. XY044]
MDLYYENYGSGIPIIFIHSGGTDSRLWSFLAPLAAKDYEVITFDGRGAGKSPSPKEPANYVEDLRVLMDDLHLDTAVLIGHSGGGQIATDFSLQYPDRVSRLVLIAPSLSGYKPSPKFERWMSEVNAAAPDADKIMELAFSAPLYRVVMSSPQRSMMVDMFRHHLAKTAEWGSFESVWPQPPAIGRLGDLRTKTLFMIGDNEIPDNERVAELFRRLPNVRYVLIPGTDHMMPLTHPEVMYSHISEFLEETH